MKINEVEALAGVTKKNIRFYEDQGLLAPRRNPENGYREYGEEEVRTLKKIRLLRKLGVPLEEIRQMQSGIHTLGDGMRRHMITLEREQRNLEQSVQLCRELQSSEIPLSQLDEDAILRRMEQMEQGGTAFRDSQKKDVRTRYIAPVIVTVIMLILMGTLTSLFIWGWQTAPEDAPPLWLIGVFCSLFAAIAAGTVAALTQRIREINKGEIDDAKNY